MKRELIWQVGFSESENIPPAKKVAAKVPGAVQLDWSKAEGYPDYTYSDNYKKYSWMEDVFWSYSTQLDIPVLKQNERVFFACKGVDYRFKVRLKGLTIHEQEGMFTPFELDITDICSNGDELEIQIFPVPKRQGALHDKSQADQCCKPAVSYGWDWHPRLIPSGIWDETYLEIRHDFHIKNSEIVYSLSKDLGNAKVQLIVQFSKKCQGGIIWRFFDCDKKLVHIIEKEVEEESLLLDFNLKSPELWWPNGHGAPTLYSSKFELYDSGGNVLDKACTNVGFRNIKLVMHQGAWDYPDSFPKTRSNPPITVEINGRRIFCKGTNWVNPEIFPGIISDDTYRPLLMMAKDANMNLLRSWGGGIINKEVFFELCDELGIMVWQEFPLACNNYEGTDEYLKILDQESRSIITRVRRHACLALWCGGNELFNEWSGMTDQSLALRLLNRNCYDLDRKTPFIMTSPLMGMAHGNYIFRYDTGEEVFQVMPNSTNTAYTEFGCPSPSAVEYLERFIPSEDLFPPMPGTAWEAHHALSVWGPDLWLCSPIIERYFGVSETLEELVERGQLLQCEGYKCIFEEARRQKPVCSMALNWCYNEPWPSAANNNIINWPCRPKPGYFAVKAACRPVLASARISKFQWEQGEIFNPELWVLNDLPNCVPGGCIEVFLKFGGEEIPLYTWNYSDIEANTNLAGPMLSYTLPKGKPGRMILILRTQNEEISSEYTLLFKSDDK